MIIMDYTDFYVFTICVICILSMICVALWYRSGRQKQLELTSEKWGALEAHQFMLIEFTRNKDVSPEVVRFWDSETRKLFNEMGWSNYDENRDGVMLELGLDTSWWRE